MKLYPEIMYKIGTYQTNSVIKKKSCLKVPWLEYMTMLKTNVAYI